MYDVRAPEFGAIGDGVADDTAAFQAACDQAYMNGGGRIIVPPGSYRLDSMVTVRGRTSVVSYGHVWAAGTHKLLANYYLGDAFNGYEGHSDITIEGGIWDGKGHLAAEGVISNVMGFIHARNITVKGATFRNVAGYHGLEFNAVDGGVAEGCRFEGYRQNGASIAREAVQIDVAVSGSSDIPAFDETCSRNIRVQGCYAGPAQDGSGLGPFGALAGSHTSAAGKWYDGIQILDNTIDGSLLYAIHGEAWRDPIIARNQITDTSGTAIFLERCSRGLVVENTIRSAGSNGVNVSGSNGVIVARNTVVSAGAAGSGYGVYVTGSDRANVAGNYIDSCASAAVKLGTTTSYGPVNHALVFGNVMRKGTGGATAVVCNAGEGTVNTVSHNDLWSFGAGASVIDDQSGTVNRSIVSTGSIGQNVA